MPTPTYKPPQGEQTIAQLQDWIIKLVRDLNFDLSSLDNHNIVNVAGFLANATEFMSKNGHVGISSDGTDPTSIRFWSGDSKTGSPNFKVTEAGILTAVAALFVSALGYPRVEMNSSNGSIGAFKDVDNSVTISPLITSSTPGINFHSISMDAFIYLLGTALNIITTTGSANIALNSGRAVILSADVANGYSTQVNSWAAFRSTATARTLQQDLDGKATNFTGINGTVYVSSTLGGVADIPITFNNGIRTS